MVRRVVLATVLAAIAGCSHDGTRSEGDERAACYGNGTCNAGLTCRSGRCVRPPGADCDEVGDVLSGLQLGNYAERGERTARATQLAAMCRALRLSKDEGACLIAARTVDDAGLCPKPMITKAHTGTVSTGGLPAACAEYIDAIERYAKCANVPASVRASLQQSVDQMKTSWAGLGSGSMSQAVNDACAQGTSAMKQAMQQLGCP